MAALGKMRRRGVSGPRGYLLVDVMLGALVMAMTIVMIAQSQLVALRSEKRTRYLEIATVAAQGELERWREAGFEKLPSSDHTATAVREFLPPSSLPGAGGEVVFTSVDAALHPAASVTPRCHVSVRIWWKPAWGRQREVVVETLIAEGG